MHEWLEPSPGLAQRHSHFALHTYDGSNRKHALIVDGQLFEGFFFTYRRLTV